MIVVHHLNASRSHRILWLLEELGLPYELRHYQRDPKTRLAPPELLAVNPLGKSPAIVDDGRVVIESAAIADYIIRHHGGGRLQPDPSTPAYDDYVQWLHFAEGSAMLPLMLHLYTSRLGEAAAPLSPRIDSEIANHLGHVDRSLAGRRHLLGDVFTAADIMLFDVAALAKRFKKLEPFENVAAWHVRMQERPAFKAAIERGGPR
ncbi:MAG: glutathione S-transferase family protein [Rhizobiaceae bacterium]